MADMAFSAELENQIRAKAEQYNLCEKEMLQLDQKNEAFKNEIEKKIADIHNFQKQFGNNVQTSKENYKNTTKATAMITLEEQILKEFSSIQQRCNLNLQEKYKLANIERLVVQQKDLNISYVIIKKLDLKDEFYLKNKIIEVPNLFENLKAISKINKLNYDSLRSCGPCLVFRLTSDSRFVDLKNAACGIWNLTESSYSLYDDVFINMECTNDANIQAYFSHYQPTDSTLPVGHACFYLMEKLKNQKNLLDMQNRTLEKADSGIENNNNKGPNIGSDLENCISKIEEGLILKGINNYKRVALDQIKDFRKKVILVENNIVYIIISIVLLVLSLYATQAKKSDILKWSNTNQIIYNSFGFHTLDTLDECIKNVGVYIESILGLKDVGLKIYGFTQMRFFQTKSRNCYPYNEELEINEIFQTLTNLKCYHSDYVGDNIDKSTLTVAGILLYYFDTLNVTHTYDTGVGKVSEGGNAIRFDLSLEDDIWFSQTFINKLFKEAKTNSLYNIQGFEFSTTVYDVNLDIFTSICILFQRQLINNVEVMEFHSIPFISNVYENNIALRAIDWIRLVLLIIMLTSILFTIIQKCTKDKRKTAIRRFIIIMTTIFKIKYLLLIFSFAFFAAAFTTFNHLNLDSEKFLKDIYFIDFFSYANNQKEARFYDMLSMYLLFIFILKYLQFLPYIGEFYKSIKKAAFELFFLCIIMLVFLLSLSYLTYYVYGIYFEQYSTFYFSLITNIKILLFVENSTLRAGFIQKFQNYSIIVFLVYIFLIRYFLLLISYPIFIEYLRIQLDKLRTQVINYQNSSLSAKDSMNIIYKLHYRTNDVVVLFQILQEPIKRWRAYFQERSEKNN